VAIIGAGGIGFDVAEYLLHDPATPLPIPLSTWLGEWGIDLQAKQNGGLIKPEEAHPIRDIYLLQRKASKVGAGLGKTSGWVHRATLQRNHVQMLAGVDYQKIDDHGLHISVGGKNQVLDVDHVILCAGQESLTELMPVQASETGPRFHKIGGAALASELDAKRAIKEGAELAASL
jgi:2,4-dienoyl-CoA reductase (NADPH2)